MTLLDHKLDYVGLNRVHQMNKLQVLSQFVSGTRGTTIYIVDSDEINA